MGDIPVSDVATVAKQQFVKLLVTAFVILVIIILLFRYLMSGGITSLTEGVFKSVGNIGTTLVKSTGNVAKGAVNSTIKDAKSEKTKKNVSSIKKSFNKLGHL